jgi:chemotaxis protein MotB
VRRQRRSAPDDEERWLLTYSDMITLLLALFIVLFAISSVNKSKFAEFQAGIKAAFVGNAGGLSPASVGLLSAQAAEQVPHQLTSSVQGPSGPPAVQPVSTPVPSEPTTPSSVPRTTVPVTGPPTTSGVAPLDTSQLAVLEREIESALAARGLLQDVVVDLSPTQLSVELLADKVFFATNSNALSTMGKEIVDTVGTAVALASHDILVKGYAANVPVKGGPWYSNFMLSAARSTAVVLRLAHADAVAESRLIAEGFGSTDPLASNATATGRAQNRRVDIDILAERT